METLFEFYEAFSQRREFEKLCFSLRGRREGVDVPPDPHGTVGTTLGVGLDAGQRAADSLS